MKRFFSRVRCLALFGLCGLWSVASGQVATYPAVVRAPAQAAPAPMTSEVALKARIEAAWMGFPGTASGRLTAQVNRNILEVHGEVPNEQSRQMALAIARDNCHLPVTDHLRIKPFQVRTPAVPTGTVAVAPVAAPARVATPVAVMPLGQPTTNYGLSQVYERSAQPQQTTQPVGYPVPAAGALRLPAQATGAVDLLTPPATTATVPTAYPEEMHLLQVPVVPGTTRTQNRTKPGLIARATQFASQSPHGESAVAGPGVLLPPTPGLPRQGSWLPLGVTTLGPESQPVAGTPARQTGAQPIASGVPPVVPTVVGKPPRDEFASLPSPRGAETQEEVERPVPAAPGTPTLEESALRQKVQTLCGALARDVQVVAAANQQYTVRLYLASVKAEEAVTPRLLAMPELKTGKVRLEIHVPQ